MPDLYACRLPLPGDGLVRYDLAVAAVRREVALSTRAEPSGQHGSATTVHGTRLRWNLVADPIGLDRVWTASWEVNEAPDHPASTVVTVKAVVDTGQASVVVRRGPSVRGPNVGPLAFDLPPPALVRGLIADLPAAEDGLPLRGEPWLVEDGEGVDRLAALLFDPHRRLPVVVITPALGSGNSPATAPRPLVDPGAVASTVAGVAHVVTLVSVPATFSLTNLVGRPSSVFNGAVRLYWPGSTAMTDPRQNTLLFPYAMLERATNSVRRALLRRLMPVAVVRSSTAALEARIRASTEAERWRALGALRPNVTSDGAPVACVERLRMARAENGRLRAEYLDLVGQVAAAEEDLRAMATRWIAGSPDETVPLDPDRHRPSDR